MNIGDYYFTDKIGTIKIVKIEVDDNSQPKIIEVVSKQGNHRILMQFARLRIATEEEINNYNNSSNSNVVLWFELEKEFPSIRSIFRTWIYEVTKKFLDDNSKIHPTRFGASTNILYCEYLLCLDINSLAKPYKFREWDYYNFNNNRIDVSAFENIKPKLQEFLFGVGQFEAMTEENNQQIQIELKDILIESFLIVRETIPKLIKCKIEIQDHDEIDSESNNNMNRIINQMK